jgi:hypothetical protein
MQDAILGSHLNLVLQRCTCMHFTSTTVNVGLLGFEEPVGKCQNQYLLILIAVLFTSSKL